MMQGLELTQLTLVGEESPDNCLKKTPKRLFSGHLFASNAISLMSGLRFKET